jgi:hypothetical protein
MCIGAEAHANPAEKKISDTTSQDARVSRYFVCMGSIPESTLEDVGQKERNTNQTKIKQRFTKVELFSNGKLFSVIEEGTAVSIEVNHPKQIGFVWKQAWGEVLATGVFDLKPESLSASENPDLHIVLNWEKKYEPEVQFTETSSFFLFGSSVPIYVPATKGVTIKESLKNWSIGFSTEALCKHKEIRSQKIR